MVVAVVVFILGGQPVAGMQAVQRFDTVAECQAFLASEAPGLDLVAGQMGERIGGEVTVATRCVDQRQSA
jgi:hypothetical protein